MNHNKPTRWIVLFALFAWVGTAQAEPKELDGTAIERAVYRSYEANWKRYAQYAAQIGEGYAFFPTYDRRFASSRNLTYKAAMDDLEIEYEDRSGGLIRKKTKHPPREDALALANALPSMRIGRYGWVASAEVVKVINEKEMIIRKVWLIDVPELGKLYKADEAKMRKRYGKVDDREMEFRYKTRLELMEQQEDGSEGFEDEMRLVGYDTRGLRPGVRYKGPKSKGFQVGVVRKEVPKPDKKDERRSRRGKERLVLTELSETMRRAEVGEEDFKKLLQERRLTVKEFVETIRGIRERERDREKSEKMIKLSLLLGDKPKSD